MSDQYGWMPWGGGQAHGPFDSYDAALKDAISYLGDDEEVAITINTIMECSGETIVDYLPDLDDMLEMASERFDDEHGCSDESMFDRVGDFAVATQELEAVLKAWAKKWVCTNFNWWMAEGEKIIITGMGRIG